MTIAIFSKPSHTYHDLKTQQWWTTSQKFSRNEDPVRWLDEYISEIEGSGGPGAQMKHICFSRCLEGAGYDWYCNILEYDPKVYWDLLPAAFISNWIPITCDVHTVEVLLNLTRV